jgi:flagellum-specific peptidoglycan hydrolase FlgJ
LISQETKTIIINESLKEKAFSPAKLKSYILELNIRFPHIVYAQAKLESGNFKSEVFKTNNNLFGMKQARKRPTTAKGTELNHAFYESWQESVVDYGMFSATYLNDIKTESDYFEYLNQNYAEDPNYVVKLKTIIKNNTIEK